VDRDRDLDVADEGVRERRGDRLARPGLDELLGELARHRQQDRVVDDAERLRQPDEAELRARHLTAVLEDVAGAGPALGQRLGLDWLLTQPAHPRSRL